MVMSNIQASVLFSHRSAVMVPGKRNYTKVSNESQKRVLAINADFAGLGYTMSLDLLNALASASISDQKAFHKNTLAFLKKACGDNVKYIPLFRKFPDDIPSISKALASLMANGDYSTIKMLENVFNTWFPDELNGTVFGRNAGAKVDDSVNNPALVTKRELKVLNLGTNDMLDEIFTNLISSPSTITANDKEFVAIHSENAFFNQMHIFPKIIPNKENLAIVLTHVPSTVRKALVNRGHVKTATDVLRIAAAFSGSDVSLADHTRFKMSNSMRRTVLQAANLVCETSDSALEDMLRYRGLWLVLAKYLHVGSYHNQYPALYLDMHILRNNPNSIATFNSEIESMIEGVKHGSADLNDLLDKISTRPGDFARRLDHILRISGDKTDAVADSFLAVADKVATPLLLNLSVLIGGRNSESEIRAFIPKGSITKGTFSKDNRKLLSQKLCSKISFGINQVLMDRFSKLPSLGNVYVDPRLEDIIAPTSMGSANNALKTLARGSQLPVTDKVVRMFLYWENMENSVCDEYYGNGRVDVDLSVQMFDKHKNYVSTVAYYALSNHGITHSGDFTVGGNAEFIDVNISKLKPNVKYVGIVVNSYTGQKFNTFTAQAGYMGRDGKTGKNFDARTVDQKFDVTASTNMMMPMVLDVDNRKMIWLDMPLTNRHDTTHGRNVGTEGFSVETGVRYAINLAKERANLLDLVMHHRNRAQSLSLVFDPEVEYDTVLDLDWASRTDEIQSQWLTNGA